MKHPTRSFQDASILGLAAFLMTLTIFAFAGAYLGLLLARML